jgi:hypothetical protein
LQGIVRINARKRNFFTKKWLRECRRSLSAQNRRMRFLSPVLKPKPVHECGDASSKKVRWFRWRNGSRAGYHASLRALSEDGGVRSAPSQS